MGVRPMTLDLSHLTAATRDLAFHDAKARILSVQTARLVAFPRAGVAVEELERRFHYPTCARMPCMLLYGDSGMGKTMILESCCEHSNVELGDIPSNGEALSC